MERKNMPKNKKYLEMKKIYDTIYLEMMQYDKQKSDKETSLTEITTKLSDRQTQIIHNTSKKLNIDYDFLLRWLLDTQFERIQQFSVMMSVGKLLTKD